MRSLSSHVKINLTKKSLKTNSKTNQNFDNFSIFQKKISAKSIAKRYGFQTEISIWPKMQKWTKKRKKKKNQKKNKQEKNDLPKFGFEKTKFCTFFTNFKKWKKKVANWMQRLMVLTIKKWSMLICSKIKNMNKKSWRFFWWKAWKLFFHARTKVEFAMGSGKIQKKKKVKIGGK